MAEEIQPQVVIPASYTTDEEFLATKYGQGGQTVYSMALTPAQITSTIKQPDPSTISEGNRRITESHAKAFAHYFIENDEWVIPGLLVRAPSMFEFEPLIESLDVQFGKLTFPRRRISDIHIIDGQHRILGFFKVDEILTEKLEKAREHKARASRAHEPRLIADAEAEIARIEAVRKRWSTERVSVELHLVDTTERARQMFFDIAENALGITNSVKVRFDYRQAVNRALAPILLHPLLEGRVEMNLDRVQRNSPAYLSARQVSEIARVLTVGFDGRISARINAQLDDEKITRAAEDFFSDLVECFAPIENLKNGTITAGRLRESMLLGNPLFIRILAGVKYELITHHAWTRLMVKHYFRELEPHVVTRAHANSIWKLYAPEQTFNENALGPSGRRADSTLLVHTMVDWAIDKAPFVSAPALPEPEPEVEEVDPDEGIDFAAGHSTKALEVELRNEQEEISKAEAQRAREVKASRA